MAYFFLNNGIRKWAKFNKFELFKAPLKITEQESKSIVPYTKIDSVKAPEFVLQSRSCFADCDEESIALDTSFALSLPKNSYDMPLERLGKSFHIVEV